MKKFIKSLSCFVLVVMFGFAFVACGKKDTETEKHEPTKETPTVSVVYEEKIYFAGDSISSVVLSLYEGSTEGTVAWENSSETLSAGMGSYKYVFTPNDTSKYSAMTKTVQVFAIGKIYKTANDEFGFKDYKNNYLEFERDGNTLTYVSNFDAGTGIVVYKNEEIILQTTGGQNKFTVEISDFLKIYDYETGDLVSTIGNLNKTYYPTYFGEYVSSQVGNQSTLNLSLVSGQYLFEFDYYSDYGNGSTSGTFTFNSNNNTFSFNDSKFGMWTGTLNADGSITTQFTLLSNHKFIKG